MPSLKITGAKLYVGAVCASALAMRATIGDAGFPPGTEQVISWALNGVASGLLFVLGPEVAGSLRDTFLKLAAKDPQP